ncbi:MAG: ferritin family protein [Candidatus Krumholzibacteriota bacterium]|nr:ferritin family protein [Candidatus Krumholzibacteriota bacterium]
MGFGSVEEILDFAIKSEERASDFYTHLAGKVKRESMKRAFLEFAEEEKGHKEKLLKIKKGEMLAPVSKKVMDLKIAEYTEDIEPNKDLDYSQALIIAMKSEKASYRMYRELAEAADNPELKKLLMGLAQEEAKHKLRFEIEYDEHVLSEN